MLRSHVSCADHSAPFADLSVISDRALGADAAACRGADTSRSTCPPAAGAKISVRTQLGTITVAGLQAHAFEDFRHRLQVCRLNAALARAQADRFRYGKDFSGFNAPVWQP